MCSFGWYSCRWSLSFMLLTAQTPAMRKKSSSRSICSHRTFPQFCHHTGLPRTRGPCRGPYRLPCIISRRSSSLCHQNIPTSQEILRQLRCAPSISFLTYPPSRQRLKSTPPLTTQQPIQLQPLTRQQRQHRLIQPHRRIRPQHRLIQLRRFLIQP